MDPNDENAAIYRAGFDTTDAQIAKAIEESLQNNQNVPADAFNDEDELARILEMSKNDK